MIPANLFRGGTNRFGSNPFPVFRIRFNENDTDDYRASIQSKNTYYEIKSLYPTNITRLSDYVNIKVRKTRKNTKNDRLIKGAKNRQILFDIEFFKSIKTYAAEPPEIARSTVYRYMIVFLIYSAFISRGYTLRRSMPRNQIFIGIILS